jgi:hypothetical protein
MPGVAAMAARTAVVIIRTEDFVTKGLLEDSL